MKRKIKALLKKEKGFTLVELLAVIVILGILAAIAIPSIGSIIAKSNYDAAKADVVQVLNAANLYISNSGVTSGTINSSDTTNVLDEYLDDATPDTLSEYTVTITDGKATINATSTKKSKTEDAPEFSGNIAAVNSQTYETHTNP